MHLLYYLGIQGYYLLVFVTSFFNKKAKLWVDGRRNTFTDLQNKFSQNEKVAWFHCASLGEFEQTRPVIEEFKISYPSYKIIVSFFSPSGYEIRKDYELADHICYLPIDTPSNAKQFIDLAEQLPTNKAIPVLVQRSGASQFLALKIPE